MVYEYVCIKCDHRFDVTKSYKDIDVNEYCPRCDAPAERQFVPSRIHISGAGVEHAEFNPAFGKVIKNRRERRYEAEKRGWVEIGNDYKEPDRIHKEMDEGRAKKLAERLDRSTED